MKMPVQEIINAMSVDVEDYFQVSAFESTIDRKDWSTLPCRVEANTSRLLQLFESRGVKATFFTLGCLAERYPRMIRQIVDGGHELASHGWNHTRVIHQTEDQFREDVSRTKKILEDLGGVEVKGYRAASYSIGADNLWALDVLAETGHQYSSSIAPVKHDLYGMPEANRFAFRYGTHQLLEVPITTVRLAGRNVNCAGGGWFRLFPYGFSRWCINRVNQQEGQAAVFYFHPWEVDPEQPRVEGASRKARFRHYLNLHKTWGRLERLLTDFQWSTMEQVFLTQNSSISSEATMKDTQAESNPGTQISCH